MQSPHRVVLTAIAFVLALTLYGSPAVAQTFDVSEGFSVDFFVNPPIHQTATQSPRLAPVPQPVGTPAQVIKVVDGDTIDVLVDGEPDTVRYIGIDTPERGDPGFAAATQANAALVEGRTVYLVTDVNDRDRYLRLLRYVYLEDGAHVNAELVRQGVAQPVEYPPDMRFTAEFRRLAREAAQAGRGFWSGTGEAMPYGLTTGAINLRTGPGTDFAIRTTLPAATPLTIFGRNEEGTWVQVRTPDRSGGWLFADLLALNVPVAGVRVTDDIPALSAPATEPSVDAVRSAPAPIAPQPDAAAQPTPTEAPTVPPPASGISIGNVTLYIIENYSTYEILGIRNDGGEAIDIGGWQLVGSKGDDRCAVPGATVLVPGEIFQVATGDSEVSGRGLKCGHKPIWNNKGETIYLYGPNGQEIVIQSTQRR